MKITSWKRTEKTNQKNGFYYDIKEGFYKVKDGIKTIIISND